ncbi:hypothetical protein AAC03nite_32540 [Alicyclobacillus acidoterrestris]|nr:hypothetical protein AAC03nite_32540 [Alicyclobacillus acidoterrestris]
MGTNDTVATAVVGRMHADYMLQERRLNTAECRMGVLGVLIDINIILFSK